MGWPWDKKPQVPPGLRGSGGGGGGNKPPRKSWYEGDGDFNRDNNTPQFSEVWGTCTKCGREQRAKKTMYPDGTVYYTAETCGHKDQFVEHRPTDQGGRRRKEADHPTTGWNDSRDNRDFGEYRQSGRDPLKGKKDFYDEIDYCSRCRDNRMVSVVKDVETNRKRKTCKECGKTWTEN